jgi:hypothetical protein
MVTQGLPALQEQAVRGNRAAPPLHDYPGRKMWGRTIPLKGPNSPSQGPLVAFYARSCI